jgi:hypothetical protein
MAQIVAAALVSHGPLVTGRPEVSKPEQRERVYTSAPVIPQMSYTLNTVLTAVARQHAIVDGLRDDDLAGYDLSLAERTALKDGDITGLYHLGANPYLIRRVFRAR